MLIKGYALNCTIAAQQMPRSIANAKIACLDISLQKVKMKIGVQIFVSDPDQLDKMRDRESDITKERINKILATGANVILTTGGIDYLCLMYFSNVEVKESLEDTMLGEVAEVVQERISDDELILIKGTNARTASSIILIGPNDFYCDEMERSVDDALCVV